MNPIYSKHRLMQAGYLLTDALSTWLACFVMGHSAWEQVLPFVFVALVVHYLSGFYLRPFRKEAFKILLTTFISTFLLGVIAFFIFRHQGMFWWGTLFLTAYIPRAVISSITGLVPLTEIQDPGTRMTDCELVLKRTFDVVTSLLVLVLFSPLYLIVAIAVKCSSAGPVFYRQERIGFHGAPFMILKFRTMVNNSEGDTPRLSQDNDPRITPVGAILRKYRLDELPQFINILRGEMSIVGPRPERPFFIAQIMEVAPNYPLVYNVRPGLASWGPILVGYTDTLDKMVERLRYDIEYIENMSIILDLKILFYTVRVILDGKGK